MSTTLISPLSSSSHETSRGGGRGPSQTGSSLPSAKAEIDELTATASGLLGLSFSPIPTTSPLPPTSRTPASRPVAIPTRKSGRRGSESAAGGSIGSSFGGGGGGSLVGGMEKKKSGGGGAGAGSLKRETLGTRSSSRSVIAPKVFDFRLADSSTPPPLTTTSSSPHTPGSSLLSPRSLPAHVSILAINGEDDGEILEDEMKDLKNGKGGKRRSASVFRCESCSKIYRHPSCLVKHRWQHSPHWQESSKLLLSKHQQVQVLEAATILVHLAPNSLPEDKSLWPAAVSPSSHPMPSISFMDSRQRSKATSTHASNLLRQHSNQTATTNTSTNSRSSEEVMSSASSPNSSAEGPEDEASSDEDDDLLGDDDDDEDDGLQRGGGLYEKGTTDSGYGGSLIKRESHSEGMAVPPPPSGAERRTSFGTATALMGRMGLGSLPLRSPASDAAAAASSPYGTSPLNTHNFSHPISSSSSYSSSPNHNTFASNGSPILPGRSSLTAPSNLQYTPLGTSPALPLRSSSLRGTGAFDEEDEHDHALNEGSGSYHAVGGSFEGGASLLARAAAALEDEEMESRGGAGGRMEMLKERRGEEEEEDEGEEEEGDWNMDDMEM